MYHLIDFCRLCLSFEGELNNMCIDDTMEKIVACINNLEFDEKLPALICTKCSDQLDKFFDFRNQCLRSEFLLNSYIEKFPLAESNNKFVNSKLNVNVLKNFGMSPNVLSNMHKFKQPLKPLNINSAKKTSKRKRCRVVVKDNKKSSCNAKFDDKKAINDNNSYVSDEDDVFFEEEDDEGSEVQSDKRIYENSENFLQKTSDLPLDMHTDITELVKIRKRAVQIRMEEKKVQDILNNKLQGNEKNIQTGTDFCDNKTHGTNSKKNPLHSNPKINIISNTALKINDRSSTSNIRMDKFGSDELIEKLIATKLNEFKNNPVISTSSDSHGMITVSPFMDQNIVREPTHPSTQTLQISPMTLNINDNNMISNIVTGTESILASYLRSNTDKVNKIYNSTHEYIMIPRTNTDSTEKYQIIGMVDEFKNSVEQNNKNSSLFDAKTSKSCVESQKLSLTSNVTTTDVIMSPGIKTNMDFENEITTHCVPEPQNLNLTSNVETTDVIKSPGTKTNMDFENKMTTHCVPESQNLNLTSNVKTTDVIKSPGIKTNMDFENKITSHCVSVCEHKIVPKSKRIPLSKYKIPINCLFTLTKDPEQNKTVAKLSPSKQVSGTCIRNNTEKKQKNQLQIKTSKTVIHLFNTGNKKEPYSVLKNKSLNMQPTSTQTKKMRFLLPSDLSQVINQKYENLTKNISIPLHSIRILDKNSEIAQKTNTKIGDYYLLTTDATVTQPVMNQNNNPDIIHNELIEPLYDLKEECIPSLISEDELNLKSEDCIIIDSEPLFIDNDSNKNPDFINEKPSTSTANMFKDCNRSLPSQNCPNTDHNYCIKDSSFLPSNSPNSSILNEVLSNKTSASNPMRLLRNRQERKKKIQQRKKKFVIDDPLGILHPFTRTIRSKRAKKHGRIKSKMTRNKKKHAGSRKPKQSLPVRKEVHNKRENSTMDDSEDSEIDVVTVGEEDASALMRRYRHATDDLNKKKEMERLRRLQFQKNLHYLDETISSIVTPTPSGNKTKISIVNTAIRCINIVQKESRNLKEAYNIESYKQKMLLKKLEDIQEINKQS